jgi:hypothetical protein
MWASLDAAARFADLHGVTKVSIADLARDFRGVSRLTTENILRLSARHHPIHRAGGLR